MAGKAEDQESAGGKAAAAPASGNAAWLGLGAASRKQADAYLREQTRLAALQAQNLTEQNTFELSHLRWRAFNEKVKGLGQILLVAVGALAVAFVALAMWNASRASGLVVESFSVPPAYAAAGLTGEVLADDLTNVVGSIRDLADRTSLVRSEDVRKEGGEDIRVEIPETGISLAQAWRGLRLWLGHERRLRGNLRNAPDGTIALTVALDGERAFTLSGPAGDLAKLEQQAAERVFESVDPNNYVIWLLATGRGEACMAAVERYAERPGSVRDRAAALSLWGGMTRSTGGDLQLSIARARAAAAMDPKLIVPHIEIGNTSAVLGHDEEALRQARLLPTFKARDQPPSWRGPAFVRVRQSSAARRSLFAGDFNRVETFSVTFPWSTPVLRGAEVAARLHDPQRSFTLLAQAVASGRAYPDDVNRARYYASAAAGDWPAAVAAARTLAAPGPVRFGYPDSTREAVPLVATALAHAGDFAGAEAAVSGLPLDCYACLRARGRVDALQGKWASADAWFAKAIAAAPSIPFAYAERGEMLLQKGDADAAIAELTLANQKGPRFADALELWGEALAAKNSPDLAIAKFEAAARYAPNWGRLHLKWGQALAKQGKADKARAQFARAAKLTLSPADRAELAAPRL